MTHIVGHNRPIEQFLAAMRGPSLHHAWLMTGPQGIGKAAIAQSLALRMLAEAAGPPLAGQTHETPETHPMARLFSAGSHPDFLRLERLPKDAKIARDVDRREWSADTERTRSITVDQVRSLGSLFALKPALSPRRVVLIDSIDDVETGGANALLKNLEEPPAGTIFMLISHSPGRLLPTIRSRCRVMRFDGLDVSAMRTVLRAQMPTCTDAEITALVTIGEGSPGRAIGFAGLDMASINAALRDIAERGDPTNAVRATLSQSLSIKSAQRRYEAFLHCAPAFVADLAKRRDGIALRRAIETWEAVRSLCQTAPRQSLDPQMTIIAVASHIAALAPSPS